jgi:hypothetical protein
MITNDSWNDRKKPCPTNRKLLAIFDAGDNHRITLVVIVHPDNKLEFPDVACGCNFVLNDMLYWQEIEIPNDRALAVSRLQETIRKERSKFIDQYGFLTDAENQILKDTIEYN